MIRDPMDMPIRGEDRTPEQYAIEHGRYLADAARHYMKTSDEFAYAHEEGGDPDREALTDAWRALQEAIHQFEKRADRAYPKPQLVQDYGRA